METVLCVWGPWADEPFSSNPPSPADGGGNAGFCFDSRFWRVFFVFFGGREREATETHLSRSADSIEWICRKYFTPASTLLWRDCWFQRVRGAVWRRFLLDKLMFYSEFGGDSSAGTLNFAPVESWTSWETPTEDWTRFLGWKFRQTSRNSPSLSLSCSLSLSIVSQYSTVVVLVVEVVVVVLEVVSASSQQRRSLTDRPTDAALQFRYEPLRFDSFWLWGCLIYIYIYIKKEKKKQRKMYKKKN